MTTLREAAQDLAQNLFCESFSNPGIRELYGRAATLGLPGTAPVRQAREDIVDTAERLYCPAPPVPPGGTTPVASGGDPAPGFCDGTPYFVTVRYTRDDGLVQQRDGRVWGPIEGVIIEPIGSSGSRVRVVGRGSTNGPIQPPGTPVTVVSAPSEIFVAAEIIDIFTQDGSPDNCGPTTPPNVTQDQPIDYDDPNGNAVSETASLSQGPLEIGPDGEPRICTTLTTPTANLTVCFNPFNGASRVGPSDLSGNDTNCCPPLQDEVPAPPTDEDPPMPMTTARFKGAIIAITGGLATNDATIVLGDFANLYVPRLATVSFGVEYGGSRFWTEPTDVKTTKQYVECPDPFVAYTTEVWADPGTSVQVTPILVDEEVTDPDVQ